MVRLRLFLVGSLLFSNELRVGRYMSSGLGPGNPYGLGAVGLVFFPVMMFFRIYYPGPPMTVLVLFVTVVLVRLPPTSPNS